ncbi:restriction endonuclease subunit S [Corynebacterium sanguinis]|uniref:restriction endonuclease subunit S n=1 Tax=Corynebacterium sanguinis TaxID=2594913 RepID=UPI0021AF49D7|nr:restriction endonuclease subunit S [Corynebacterium sanguinis]MCT1445245.1 restriction endonuclease subunit S [Corynebacterium sanguinis]MCT1695958.1 restriction endonuclease subunit S [Corynebacterium sanguinis]MCT1715387.1 restriction endonuclease subunit S [Corynebacterium sanguinis]
MSSDNSWNPRNIMKLVSDETRGHKRIPTADYQLQGRTPVVDQSQILVAGYTEEPSTLTDPPYIVFGDHTREIKYLEQPFLPGAQGVRILKATQEADSKFLYHYLAFNKVQNLGYSRHFKLFKQIEIHLPPLAEQQRIAEILDNAASLIEASTAKINGLNELEESSFLFLFGDESVSTTTDEVAAKYKNSIRTGPFGSQLKHGEFVNEGISVLGLDNVVSNQFRWASPRFITPEKYEQLKRYTVHPGDVLISIMGTTGRCAIVPDNLPTTINTKHICAITTDRARMLPEFLRAAFLWHPEVRQSLRQQTKGAIMAGLNMGIIRNLPLPAPEMSQQRAWSEFTSEINKLREKLLEQELLSRELHQTLATRAFAGDL